MDAPLLVVAPPIWATHGIQLHADSPCVPFRKPPPLQHSRLGVLDPSDTERVLEILTKRGMEACEHLTRRVGSRHRGQRQDSFAFGHALLYQAGQDVAAAGLAQVAVLGDDSQSFAIKHTAREAPSPWGVLPYNSGPRCDSVKNREAGDQAGRIPHG